MTEDLTQTALDADTAREDASPAAPAVSAAKPHGRAVIADGFRNHTRGETLFNRITYLGVGYFGVTGVSVFLTWLLRDYHAVAPSFKKMTTYLQKSLENHSMPGLAKIVDSNMTILTLFLGGSLASVLPVKWLEDNKSKIVQNFDRKIYGKEVVENDPEIRAAHEAMEAMPKQTWSSVITSRVLAFATTFGTSFLMGSERTPVGKATGHSIDSISTRAGRSIDRRLNKNNPEALRDIEKAVEANFQSTHDDGTPFTQPVVMREWSGTLSRLNAKGEKYDAEHVDWKIGTGADRIPSRVFSYITLDGLYTVVTSATLYIFTRVLAPILGKKQKLAHDEIQSPLSTLQAPLADTAPHAAAAEEKAGPAPRPHVSQPAHHQRLAEPVTQEITA